MFFAVTRNERSFLKLDKYTEKNELFDCPVSIV